MASLYPLAALTLLGLAGPTVADEPVRFDSRRAFACTALKPPEGADAGRKVLLVSIPISTNFEAPEASVERLRFEIHLPKSFTVVDHLPKTQTAADVLALKERRIEDTQSQVNIEFGGSLKSEFNAYGARFHVGAGGNRQSRDFTQVKTDIQVDRLPPRKQVIVAGTEDEGQTLYFELPWHNQETRAGQKEYAVLAEVSKDWTGDVGLLVCKATGEGRVLASMTKAVGFYLGTDAAARKRVEDQARATRLPSADDAPDVLTTSIGLKLKRIPAGTFLMGADPDAKKDDVGEGERPQHRVTLTRPFFLGTCEVTQNEYRQVAGKNPSHQRTSDQLPVESVSWYQAVAFCNGLSQREGREPYYRIDGREVAILGGDGFRLPTEAEWEYACRAGGTTEFSPGPHYDYLKKHAWSWIDSKVETHPVGRKAPNRFGLFDMLGNVSEWCGDYYSPHYFANSPPSDPPGPASGSERVLRGGYYFHPKRDYAWSREKSDPGSGTLNWGFRVAASAD